MCVEDASAEGEEEAWEGEGRVFLLGPTRREGERPWKATPTRARRERSGSPDGYGGGRKALGPHELVSSGTSANSVAPWGAQDRHPSGRAAAAAEAAAEGEAEAEAAAGAEAEAAAEATAGAAEEAEAAVSDSRRSRDRPRSPEIVRDGAADPGSRRGRARASSPLWPGVQGGRFPEDHTRSRV